MEQQYHSPTVFRYNLNAFLSALKSTVDFIRLDLEKVGLASWWTERSSEFKGDRILSGFTIGRNIALHQREVVEGSHLEVGLFRGRRMKLVITAEDGTARTSEELLQAAKPAAYKIFIAEEHSAVGEQLGVLRLYYSKDISEVDHVAAASAKALARLTQAMSAAHEQLGFIYDPISEEDIASPTRIAQITVLLESDVDPDLPKEWGW